MKLEKIVVLHTNDIHSRFERMPKISSLIKQQRNSVPEEQLIVIDGGDHIDRVRMETEGTDGLVNIQVMNEAGYDYAVPGNNEGLTLNPDRLLQLYREHANFKVLAANMYRDGALKPPMIPYDIVRKGNLRVGIIGVTIDFTSFYELLGWELSNPMAIVQQTVEQIRDTTDLIILVSHLGIANDQMIASQTQGIDVIIGGHTHHLLKQGEMVEKTMLTGAGKYGEYVGRIEIEYSSQKEQIVNIQAECLPTEELENDPITVNIIDKGRKSAKKQLSQPIARLTAPLEIHWAAESPLGNLLAAGIRKWTQADIGLVNSGQILHTLAAGEVTLEKLLEACPSPINPCKLQLEVKHIRQALEESLHPDMQQMPIRGYGFRGEILGCLNIDGAQVEYDPKGKPGSKIIRILLETENGTWKELQDEQVISVGTLDMFTFGAGYLSLKNDKQPQYYLPEFIRDVLAVQLSSQSDIDRSHTLRWIARS